jgi:hypothetical protein
MELSISDPLGNLLLGNLILKDMRTVCTSDSLGCALHSGFLKRKVAMLHANTLAAYAHRAVPAVMIYPAESILSEISFKLACSTAGRISRVLAM